MELPLIDSEPIRTLSSRRAARIDRPIGHRYHHVVRRAIARHGPAYLLDVYSGITHGVNWLRGLPHFDRTAIEKTDGGKRLDGVDLHFGDFRHWKHQARYDFVTCLHGLDGEDDPTAVCDAMFARAVRKVIIAVPNHDADRLPEWTSREPTRLAKSKPDTTVAFFDL